MGIIISLLILSLVIVVHEYGHYFVMRRNGIKVLEFTIGFGPTLWSYKLKSGTVFMVKPIPLGGYAKPIEEGPESMEAATRWVKFKVAMAGMLFNSIAACLTLTVFMYVTGAMPSVLVPFAQALVGWGLPRLLVPVVIGVIGSFGIWLATPVMVIWLLVTGLGNFVSGMAGPVGIIQLGSHMVGQAGPGAAATAAPTIGDIALNAAFFFYLLNSAVAGCNLLPLHPLDGSFIPVLLLDKFGGRFRQKLVNGYRLATMFLFIALIVLAFYSDFARLFAGKVLGQQ